MKLYAKIKSDTREIGSGQVTTRGGRHWLEVDVFHGKIGGRGTAVYTVKATDTAVTVFGPSGAIVGSVKVEGVKRTA